MKKNVTNKTENNRKIDIKQCKNIHHHLKLQSLLNSSIKYFGFCMELFAKVYFMKIECFTNSSFLFLFILLFLGIFYMILYRFFSLTFQIYTNYIVNYRSQKKKKKRNNNNFIQVTIVVDWFSRKLTKISLQFLIIISNQ